MELVRLRDSFLAYRGSVKKRTSGVAIVIHSCCVTMFLMLHMLPAIMPTTCVLEFLTSCSQHFRGLYSSLFQEKPPYRKLLFLADFIENWVPFIENSILTIFTDPKAKRSENVLNNQIQSHLKP